MGCSDAILVGQRPHPRGWGTFPRWLGRYVRDAGVFTLEAAVHKLTAMPAERFGLLDRGRLEVGMAADLVVFDAATIADESTLESPRRPPRGIHAVVVNGSIVWRDGSPTGRLPGKALTPIDPKR